MKKLYYFFTLSLIVLTIFLGIPAKAGLVGNTTKATLSLSPASGSFSANDTFKVSIYLNTNGQNVVAVGAYLKYDKNYFQAIDIETTSSIFSMETEKTIDATAGKIKIGRGSPTPGIITANGLVASINFKALSNVSPASDNFIFDFTPGIKSIDSDVILDDGMGTDILSGVNNAKYTVGTGGPVTYSDGSILRANNSDKVYLIENGQKRWIPTGDIFTSNGYSWSSIIVVDPSVLAAYPDGANVSAGTSATISEGALIRAVGDIDVYIVKYVGAKKFKRLVLSPSVFNSYQHLKWGDIKDIEKSVVDSFTTSELVRAVNDPKVYKLYPSGDTGEKRWVTTAEAFINMGFDWDAIYEINQVDRDSYVEGAVIQ